MKLAFDQLAAPVSAADLATLTALARRVFGEDDPEAMAWRFANMPDVSVFLVSVDGEPVGFKAGYAATMNRYYSWLGGIDPSYRGQGIAGALMERQHAWLASTRFTMVETHVRQANDAMVALNMKHGLRVTGMFVKRGEPNFIMQREFS